MPAESSTAGHARRGRRASAGKAPSTPAEPLCRRDETAETSSSSPRLEGQAAAERSAGSPGKLPGKAAIHADGRADTRSGASALQQEQPPTKGKHSAKPQPDKTSKRQTGHRGVWPPAAEAVQQHVASAQLVSWPGAAVLLLAIALGAWVPSQREGDSRLISRISLQCPARTCLQHSSGQLPIPLLYPVDPLSNSWCVRIRAVSTHLQCTTATSCR